MTKNPVIQELEKKMLSFGNAPSWAKRAVAEIERLEKERDGLLEALDKAADVFDFYAKHHATKTIPDEEKAQQNYAHRNMCRAAIASVKGGAA